MATNQRITVKASRWKDASYGVSFETNPEHLELSRPDSEERLRVTPGKRDSCRSLIDGQEITYLGSASPFHHRDDTSTHLTIVRMKSDEKDHAKRGF
jgi:hypothetical protein